MEMIVLAGGLGTRLRSAVPELPKALAPISGRPFLEYLLDYWKNQGIRRVTLSVGYRAGAIQSHFGKKYNSIELEYSPEEFPLGTGGALIRAARYVESSPFIVVNGDTFAEVSAADLLKFHREKKADMSLALLPTPAKDKNRYGTVQLESNGKISKFIEKSSAEATSWMSGGIYLCESSLLHDEEERASSLELELFPKWIKSGSAIFGFRSDGAFIDIGTPDDYARASKLLHSSRE